MGARGIALGVAVLLTVAGGAVVVDRAAVSTAQGEVVRELRRNFDGVVGEPAVTIEGFPFLTQVLAGTLTDVTARVDGVTVDGVAVTGVRLDAAGVSTSQPYTVHQAVLSATLPSAALEQLIASKANLDVALRLDGNRLVAATTLLGLDVTATVVPRAQDGRIRVDIADVTLGGLPIGVGDLPGAVAARLRNLTIPFDGLPAGMRLAGVVVRDGGVRITAAGTDVALSATRPTP